MVTDVPERFAMIPSAYPMASGSLVTVKGNESPSPAEPSDDARSMLFDEELWSPRVTVCDKRTSGFGTDDGEMRTTRRPTFLKAGFWLSVMERRTP